MFRPPNLQGSFFILLILVACLVAQGIHFNTNNYNWQDDPHQKISGVKEIDVDMENLGSTRNSSLELYDDSTDYVYLEIEASISDSLEPCSHHSNRLLLQRGSANETATLMCGNEVVQRHVTRFHFTLIFIKGSGISKSQLNKFKITVWHDPDLHSFYQVPVLSQPGIYYSPLYPDFYEKSTNYEVEFIVKKGYAVFFQLRFMKLEDNCLDILKLSGGDDLITESLCEEELTTIVMKPRNYDDGISASFASDTSVQNRGFELEYRSVKINSQFKCAGNAKYNLAVKEATLVSLGLKLGNNCSLTLKAETSQRLVLTSLSFMNHWSFLCDSFIMQVFVGVKALPLTVCDISAFGVIRAPPGQDIRVNFFPKASYLVGLSEVSFVVEAYEPETLPEAVNAHFSTSYIWIPGFSTERDNEITQVRSPIHHCVEFSTLNKNFKQKKDSLGNSMRLYSGFATEGNYKLTEDCLGKLRTDNVVNNGRHRITTAVSFPRSACWMRITRSSDKPCESQPTYLDLSRDDITYSLFGWKTISSIYYDDVKVPISKYMTCKFVLPPKVSVPGTPSAIQFRGQLLRKNDAELYVTEDENTSYVMANFRKTQRDGLSAWFFSSNILYIYFRTGSDVSEDMAKFEYKFTGVEPIQACSGPIVHTLYETKDYFTPNYPNHFQTNMTCGWKFIRPYDTYKYIHVFIDDLDLPCHSSTKLYIKGENDDNLSVSPVCDVDNFRKVFPDDVEISLIGGPDNVISGIRFQVILQVLDYESVCNKTYEIKDQGHGIDLSGTLNDGHYLIPFYCKIHLHVNDPDGRLIIHIKKVVIDDAYYSYDCNDKNGLTIYDGANTFSSMLIHTCFNNGDSLTSTSNSVLVEIAIRERVEHRVVFDMSIKKSTETSCGDMAKTLHATERSQYFTSPGYPTLYGANLDCSWKIESTDGNQVEIEITDMDLEYSRTCSFDYVEVIDGPSNSFPILGRACGEETKKPKFRSSNEVLFVNFVSDSADEDNGFRIRYYTKLHPSTDLEDGQSSGNSDDDEDSGTNNKTGVIIGGCLSAIVGIFGFGFLCVCLVHKKRMRDLGNRRRRRREAAFLRHRTNQESSVYVINPLIVNNAPPPPYSGLINQGFLEEPPPSYRDALSQLPPPPALCPASDTTPARAPPPPYSVSIPRGHEAISEDEEAVYDNPTASNDDNSSNVPIYETLRPVGSQAPSNAQEGSSQDQGSEQLEQQNRERPTAPPSSPSAAATLQLPQSPNHLPQEDCETENNVRSSSPSLPTPDPDYNLPKGDCTDLREDLTMMYSLATEQPSNGHYSLAGEGPNVTAVDIHHTPSPISNPYSLAGQPDNETSGEYNLAYEPESDENIEYSLAQQPRNGEGDYDLAHNSEANGNSEINTQGERSSRSLSSDSDCDYDLALHPDDSSGQRAVYSSSRARRNNDNDNGANGSGLAVHRNRNRARSPVNGQARNHPSPDRKKRRPKRDGSSLGSL